MTGGRCHEKKMMGRGADGGCGTEERPCPIPRVPPKIPATQPEIPEKSSSSLRIDFFSQAKKALCERSPFDVAEDGSASSLPTTLPRGLASFLSRQSDSRKRHKKSHAGAEKKSSRQSERSRCNNIWVETEDYFRPLTLPDIDALFQVSELSNLASRKCFSIPVVGNVPRRNANENVNANGVAVSEDDASGGKLNSVVVKDEIINGGNANDSHVKNENANDGDANDGVVKAECANDGNANSVLAENANENGGNENGVVEDEAKTEKDEHSMEIDCARASGLPEGGKGSLNSYSPSGVEWLLGYRNKISLTSERPSKKRKVLGADAGLEKVLIASPCDGSSSLCHFCCMGDAGKESNRLIVCSSCKVGVHQKCYGHLEDVDASWLCSWCKQKTDTSDSVKPCLLCSKKGGALKPVLKSVENGGSMDFAHLFCCQWMPEVYIEDIAKMEPIINVGGITETRRKLICNICKVKWGACVRCSHGTCRTSFHPLCAREARQRMEIWGKYGCDNVELRAFCSKHSEVPDNSNSQLVSPTVSADKNSNVSNHLPMALSENKLNKLRIGPRNGDKTAVPPDIVSDKSGDSESQEIVFPVPRLNSGLTSDGGEAQPMIDAGAFERSKEDVNASNSLKFSLILKKLIDCGKVNVKDVALDIGLSPDSLSASLADHTMAPDVQSRIVKWLRDHSNLDLKQKNGKMKLRSAISSITEFGGSDGSEAASLSDSDMADVAVKSVPPRRRTKSSIRILKDNKVISSSEGTCNDNGTLDKIKVDQPIIDEQENLSKASVPDPVEKNLTEADVVQNSLLTHSPRSEGLSSKPLNCSPLQMGQEQLATIPLQGTSVVPELNKSVTEEVPGCYVHPYIENKLLEMQTGVSLENPIYGSSDGVISRMEASSHASVCCNHQNKHPKCCDMICKSDEMNLEQLVKAQEMGVLEMSPEDEVEGELIYYQHRLLNNAIARKHFTDNLVSYVAKSLPLEIDAARRQKWDAVLVNQYLCELREAKKQGRKERRHKEAQAVLAAATAAAAASSRISSFRKDALDESSHQENVTKLNTSSGRSSFSSQMMPRPKETFPRMAVPRISLEKHSGFVQSVTDFSKEHPRSCDICRRSETLLNPILVCSSCKVAIHLDCYRRTRESAGPWYCELCEELSSSRGAGAPVNFWEKDHFVAECGLCGGKTGAFRKCSDGKWVHAFCAEWIFESTFRRGQVSPIEGMETISKGLDFCVTCRRKCGVCIKCNYGNCQSTFHASCARSSGFYMNVKTVGGKIQHKAYCEKHSVEQRTKAETQKHGTEELENLRKIRVELERVRLLCERIVKREKVKRELLICSHDLLAVRRDHVARSVLVNSPFLPPNVSSESATTSLNDVTVDSTISVKRRRVPITIDNDQKTDDDSSTSQNHSTKSLPERPQLSEKQIPCRASSAATCNLSEDGGWRSKSRKHAETFEKELVMTSDQASMKNMKLPKGYAYVPADCIPNEKQINQDSCSGEQPQGDG
ncbi:hypothetical protein FF1_019575 [Malus domestica]|uniref:uncharacterized protein isoform X2 n=1 Tax=Malus domestica TaxID=3750 RepID=UPI003975835B